MTPILSDAWLTVYEGDCRAVLAILPERSIHCVVTSPPFWGLRDYGVDGQLGLEPTPEEYVANLVGVFREVRRVLRDDGTVWLNLGDSYANDTKWGGSTGGKHVTALHSEPVGRGKRETGLKAKDLVGIPWRVAFALQADGWYLRSDIIWSKPNPMPESVTDRPTKSHEYLFLLSKSPRYYFDADAVREAAGDERVALGKRPISERQAFMQEVGMHGKSDSLRDYSRTARNLRSVWTIATSPYSGKHFAVFPRKLVEPCVKAGTSERGVCPECGAPWVRVVERERGPMPKERGGKNYGANAQGTSPTSALRKVGGEDWYDYAGESRTTGWRPSCRRGERGHSPHLETHEQTPAPALVLDPFAGSGTVGMVAQSLSRRAILIDLNADYLVQALKRNHQAPLGLGA